MVKRRKIEEEKERVGMREKLTRQERRTVSEEEVKRYRHTPSLTLNHTHRNKDIQKAMREANPMDDARKGWKSGE